MSLTRSSADAGMARDVCQPSTPTRCPHGHGCVEMQGHADALGDGERSEAPANARRHVVSLEGIHRFALQDELGRMVGIFTSHRRGWRIGDWVLTGDGRRLQIVGVLPAVHADDDSGVSEVWLVESA
jgi:hypothetical protein